MKGKRKPRLPFEGEPPAVRAGDPVWCRTAGGRWVPRVALDEPRYDAARAFEVVWLSVPVCKEEDVGRQNYGASPRHTRHTWPLPNRYWFNWPAADVRLRRPGEPPPEAHE